MPRLLYSAPADLKEVFDIMDEYGDRVVLTAGGTDVAVDLRSGRNKRDVVVQLKNVAELSASIMLTGDEVIVGALATLTDIAADENIRKYYSALVQAADSVGSLQIRNRATMAGNICNASPAADAATALLLYEGWVGAVGREGKRRISIGEFFLGPRRTALQKGELVECIALPVPKQRYGSSYARMSRRKGVDLSMLSVGGLVTDTGEVRVALGALGPKPFRPQKTEAALLGSTGGQVTDAVLDLLETEASPISDLRATREYRLAMMRENVRRAVGGAFIELTQKMTEVKK